MITKRIRLTKNKNKNKNNDNDNDNKILINTKDINDIWDSFKEFDTNNTNIITDLKKNDEYSILSDYKCIDCNTFTLVSQDGHSVCTSCGLQQNKKLSHCAEYRFYGDSDNKSSNPERVGMVTNYLLFCFCFLTNGLI